MDTTYNEHLTQLAERHLEAKLRDSWLRVAIGFASAAGFLTWSYVEFSRLGYLPAFGILLSGFILAGGTPKLFHQMRTIAFSTERAHPAYQNQQNSIRRGLVTQKLDSATIRTLQRNLRIAFIVRMLGLVVLLSLYPIATILTDNRAEDQTSTITSQVRFSFPKTVVSGMA